MSTHNIGFHKDLTKIIFELSSNTHLISSAEIFPGIFPETDLISHLTFFWIPLYNFCNIM